jgi:hypothetical protein
MKNLLVDPTRVLKLESIQSHENMVVIPLILDDIQVIEFDTLLKGEKEGFAFIQEKESEQVAQLEAVNNGLVPILIPFLQTISGGRQDRTVFEPILVPAQTSEKASFNIPSKCVEQSRWHYRNNVRNAPRAEQKRFLVSKMRVSPSSSKRALSAKYMQLSEQSEMWGSIGAMRSSLNIPRNVAPDNSHIEMAKHKEKEIEYYKNSFELLPGQTGVALLINGNLIGIEIYGNPGAFRDYFEEIINAYALESLIRKKDKPVDNMTDQEAQNEFLGKFNIDEMEFTTRKGVGLGEIVEFRTLDTKWTGISLTHENKIAHFYLVAETALPRNRAPGSEERSNRIRTSGLNRRFRI